MFKPSTPSSAGPPVDPAAMQVSVRQEYLSDQSDPETSQYVFAYDILIENVGADAAQLFWRHWYIHDPAAGDQEIEGEGVVGESPRLEPGESHSYQSFCVLRGKTGHMEGFYHFRRDDGSVFKAAIPRFELQVPPGDGGTFLT
ncbi:MAG: Co2+/Mg2+ efflux protein ApaG [Gemmatimonadota bacterium]|nr:Co2+/Mg2+ efflux protein ApaG [Gemmatimonadota bacterium]